MKKILLIAGLFSILGIFNSCTEEYYYNDIKTVVAVIYSEDWKFYTSDIEEYYYYELELSELNRSVLLDGDVNVCIQEDGRNGSITLYPLPDVKTYDNGEVIYTQVISFELLSPNTIAFKAEMTDLQSARPNTLKFKITITYPPYSR